MDINEETADVVGTCLGLRNELCRNAFGHDLVVVVAVVAVCNKTQCQQHCCANAMEPVMDP